MIIITNGLLKSLNIMSILKNLVQYWINLKYGKTDKISFKDLFPILDTC